MRVGNIQWEEPPRRYTAEERDAALKLIRDNRSMGVLRAWLETDYRALCRWAELQAEHPGQSFWNGLVALGIEHQFPWGEGVHPSCAEGRHAYITLPGGEIQECSLCQLQTRL